MERTEPTQIVFCPQASRHRFITSIPTAGWLESKTSRNAAHHEPEARAVTIIQTRDSCQLERQLEGPSTQYLRLLVPKTMKGMALAPLGPHFDHHRRRNFESLHSALKRLGQRHCTRYSGWHWQPWLKNLQAAGGAPKTGSYKTGFLGSSLSGDVRSSHLCRLLGPFVT